LIIQTSSKSRTDNVQAGQYGTGFLTTHKFGLKFELSGSLKVFADRDLYSNFCEFEIDRSTPDVEKMIENLETKTLEGKSLIKKYPVCPVKEEITKFKYIQKNVTEYDNTEKAFKSAPVLSPYVISLN